MSTYSKMQLLKMVENQQLSPDEALKIIRETNLRTENKPQEEKLLSNPADTRQELDLKVRKLLVDGVATLLKVPVTKIHEDENWKSFGFDSISFTAFHSYLAEKLQFSFSLDVFFEYSTIAELSEYLISQHTGEAIRLNAEEINVSELIKATEPATKTVTTGRGSLLAPMSRNEEEDSMWLINSSDEFFMDFWKNLSDTRVNDISYRPLSLTELGQVQHKYVQLLVNTSIGKKMEVVISGKGKPMVIVGGVGMASPMILNQMNYFSQHSRVICIHNPGCGLSEDIHHYALEDRVKIIVEVLNQLGIQEPVDFVGISWGGLVGQYFSAFYPERVSSLMLVSSIYEIVNENPQMNADDAMKKDLEAVDNGLDSLELLECGKSIDKKIFTQYMEYYLPGNQKSYTTFDILSQINVPVLIVYGKKDTIINTRQSKVMIDTIPGARFLEIEDAAHFLFMTHHEVLNPAIKGFISGINRNRSFSLLDSYAQLLDFEHHREAELNIKGLECYEGLEESLNELCMSYAYHYFKQAGIDTGAGAIHDRNDWFKQLGILPQFSKLVDCMIDMLTEDGIVKVLDSRVKFVKEERTIPDPRLLYDDCLRKYPSFQGMIKFLDYCVGNYKDALCGRIPPVSVLFPKGSSDALEQSNKDTVEHGKERVYAQVIGDILRVILDQTDNKKEINILEVGGGTGLLTRQLLSIAGLPNVNYYFTDIGEYFINKAKQNSEFGHLNFKLFDITRSPVQQGLELHSFDIVLGLNVVHATKDIIKTLTNLKQLLVPDGVMMLIEACKRLRWVDMVWGLAEGWWYFEDNALRDKSPIIHAYAWERAFQEAGFKEIKVLPGDDSRRFDADCALVSAHG
ncbi:alpha/beta fold hydrolase [Paenibacillus sp. BR2-3]|uniref:alpha/beta fold hydrolase n=1 Tax=Paenibacillus sp. BR2-3 TaxID=3048494 RepID=UPI00397767E3